MKQNAKDAKELCAILREKIRNLQSELNDKIPLCTNELQTKNCLIHPFLMALGYNVSDPRSCRAEYPAGQSANKKPNKVDYAFLNQHNEPTIVIECKAVNENLDVCREQLSGYYAATKAKMAVLCNGIEYRFFLDTKKENLMDDTPVFIFNHISYTESDLFLLYFCCWSESIPQMVENFKNMMKLRDIIQTELANPGDAFCRFLYKRLGNAGHMPSDFKATVTASLKLIASVETDAITSAESDKILMSSISENKKTAISPENKENKFPFKVGKVMAYAFRVALSRGMLDGDINFLMSTDAGKLFKTRGYAVLASGTKPKKDKAGVQRFAAVPVVCNGTNYWLTTQVYKEGLPSILSYLENHGMSRTEIIDCCKNGEAAKLTEKSK